jgi:hypothetical protein
VDLGYGWGIEFGGEVEVEGHDSFLFGGGGVFLVLGGGKRGGCLGVMFWFFLDLRIRGNERKSDGRGGGEWMGRMRDWR